MTISIIIPAYNEEKYLEKTLQSITSQDSDDYELIVIANGCTDKTVEIARRYADKIYKIDKPSVSLARNIGAQRANNDTLLFLDADTTLAPNALTEIKTHFGHKHSIATLKAYPNAPKFHYVLLNMFKNFLHKTSLYAGSSGILICRKQHFNQVHGFNPRLTIKENRNLISKLKKSGSYLYIHTSYVTTSTRRYERWGLLKTTFFWLINKVLIPRNVKYEPVR